MPVAVGPNCRAPCGVIDCARFAGDEDDLTRDRLVKMARELDTDACALRRAGMPSRTNHKTQARIQRIGNNHLSNR